MSVPFSYQYRATPIHRLNALSRLLLFGSFMLVGGIYLDPRIQLFILVALLMILLVAKLPFNAYKAIIVLAILGTAIGRLPTAVLMVDPEYFKVYPHDWVSKVILEITDPDFPIFGRAAITYGAVIYEVSIVLQPIIVILSVAGLLHTTSLSDIVSILSKLRLPYPVIFMVTVALRFVPVVAEDIRLIQTAQSLRGWTLETRNPFRKISRLRPLFVPLTRSIVRSVDVMSMSSKNRAFGLGPVTPLADFSFAARDKAVCAVVIALTALAIYGTFAWNLGRL